MTTPSEGSDNRGPDEGANNADSNSDRTGGIYRRPRRRTNQDLQNGARVSDEAQSEQRPDSSDPSSSIYTPPRRRRVRSETEDRKPGIFGRLTGRQRLDEIRVARYEPYTYESNEQNAKWVTVAMGVWCVVLIWLAFTDYGNSQRYQEWIDQGITVIPPSPDLAQQIEPAGSYAQREGGEEFKCAYLSGGLSTSECPDGVSDPIKVSNFVDERGLVCWNYDDYTPGTTLEIPDDEAVTTGLDTEASETVRICTAVWTSYGLLRFAEQAGLDCPDVDAVVASISTGASEYPGCERALSYAEDFQASQDRSRLIWLLVIVSVIIVAFPYLSLIHRASRNLLPLQSEQQKHAPEWAVLHHFIPIMNLFRPGQVMKEMFKGSDPDVNTDDATAWKKQGKLRAILGLWWILWVASWIFNPITVPRFVNAQSLPELIEANDLLLLSDVLLIFLGVSAVLMLRQLHAIQEMKFEKIGLITVTPPPPVDPLAEALKKQEEQQRAKEERKNRRGR